MMQILVQLIIFRVVVTNRWWWILHFFYSDHIFSALYFPKWLYFLFVVFSLVLELLVELLFFKSVDFFKIIILIIFLQHFLVFLLPILFVELFDINGLAFIIEDFILLLKYDIFLSSGFASFTKHILSTGIVTVGYQRHQIALILVKLYNIQQLSIGLCP